MFELIEKDNSSIFRLTIRIAYIFFAVAVDLGVLYVAIFPGSTKDERFARFLTGALLLMVSLILAIPVLPYVVWKFVKHEPPKFWTIAFVIAIFPILLMIIEGASGP